MNKVVECPGSVRGSLDCHDSEINEAMKVATSYALAKLVKPEELREDYILPNALDKRISRAVADAVIQAAHETGVARI